MPADSRRLLAHEWLFGGFLLLMWARLAWAADPLGGDTLVFGALATAGAGLTWNSVARPGAAAWRWRLVFYPLAMNVTFPVLGSAIPAVNAWRGDAWLQSVDELLVGGNLSLALEPWVRPWATELFSACYLVFFPYLGLSILRYFFQPLPLLRRFTVGLFSVYGLGFLGYSLVPASGPWIAMAERFTVPLSGWHFTQWNDALVRMGSNGVDVFPSLHCAVTAYLLAFDFRHRRRRFWFYLLPCMGLWVSTIYLRYHYFIDIVAGFALAALAWALVTRTREPAA